MLPPPAVQGATNGLGRPGLTVLDECHDLNGREVTHF